LQQWFADDGMAYTWSGIRMEPEPWIAPLERLRARLHEALGLRFNTALANLYRDGNDTVGWHAGGLSLGLAAPLLLARPQGVGLVVLLGVGTVVGTLVGALVRRSSFVPAARNEDVSDRTRPVLEVHAGVADEAGMPASLPLPRPPGSWRHLQPAQRRHAPDVV
jgi:hypothetical protein